MTISVTSELEVTEEMFERATILDEEIIEGTKWGYITRYILAFEGVEGVWELAIEEDPSGKMGWDVWEDEGNQTAYPVESRYVEVKQWVRV